MPVGAQQQGDLCRSTMESEHRSICRGTKGHLRTRQIRIKSDGGRSSKLHESQNPSCFVFLPFFTYRRTTNHELDDFKTFSLCILRQHAFASTRLKPPSPHGRTNVADGHYCYYVEIHSICLPQYGLSWDQYVFTMSVAV